MRALGAGGAGVGVMGVGEGFGGLVEERRDGRWCRRWLEQRTGGERRGRTRRSGWSGRMVDGDMEEVEKEARG